MRQKLRPSETAEQHMRDTRRATRQRYSAEEKIRIVLSGLRSEHSIAELCPHEAIGESLYDAWRKEFLQAGKKRLAGDTERQAYQASTDFRFGCNVITLPISLGFGRC
jgi:transposase